MNDQDTDPTPHVTVTIPTPRQCLPARVGSVGGRNRVHPTYEATCSDGRSPTAITDWGPGALRSVQQPLRVTFHDRAGTFAAFSRKARRTVSGRGPHELANFEGMEVDPHWVDLSLEGARLEWDGTSYTGDFVGLHAERGIVVGEVKADRSYFAHPDYAPTVVNSERLCARLGVGFDRVVGTDMHGDVVRRVNVRRAYIDRFTDVPRAACDAVADLFARERAAPLARVEEVAAPGRADARAVVHSMLCARRLSFDLNLPVGRDTLVGPAPVAAVHADIRRLDLSEAA